MERIAESGVADRSALLPLREAVEDALETMVREVGAGAPPGVDAVLRYAVLGRGKRIRPVLLLACYRALGGDHPSAARLACAVELVHAYSLIHDDLPCMDDDALRRGRPTVHVRYGIGAAMLAGALLLPTAVRALVASAGRMELSEAATRRLLLALTDAAGPRGMVGGQYRDLRAEGRRISAEALEELHRGKTGALMAAAAEMGGIAAGASDSLLLRYRAYGDSLGIAFQVVDDILDRTGRPAETGKAVGRDRARRKASAPRVLGLEAARRLARSRAEVAVAEVEGLPGFAVLSALADAAVDRAG